MLDALHTCQESLRKIHQDNGADYLLPVKGNHEALENLAAACLPPPDPEASGEKPAAARKPTQPIQQSAELSPLRLKRWTSSAAPSGTAVRYRRKRGR